MRYTASPSSISVLPASTDNAVAPATRIAWIVANPTTGTSNRMSCVRLRHLDDADAGTGEMSGAADHFVGALHRLDGDDRLVLDRDGLPDIEAGDDVSHLVAELEVTLLVLSRRTLGQHAGPGQQRRQQRGRVDQLDAVLAQDVGDGTDQAIGVSRRELAQHRDERHVRDDATEDLGVLDLSGHDRGA